MTSRRACRARFPARAAEPVGDETQDLGVNGNEGCLENHRPDALTCISKGGAGGLTEEC